MLVIAWIVSLLASASLYRNVGFGVLGGVVFQLAVTAAFGCLAIGVLQRWRWMFFMLLVLYLLQGLSVLSLPAGISNLRMMQEPGTSDPVFADYVEGQIKTMILVAVAVSLPAFLTGIAMVVGLRKSGVWGEF